MYFSDDNDHDRSPNKKDCDHGHSPIKTQKYIIFVRTVIYGPSPIKTQKHGIFVRTATQKYGIFVRLRSWSQS